MSRVLFYFDKFCIEKAVEKVKEIFGENGVKGVCVISSNSSIPHRYKEFISYDLGYDKINDIIRNFDWESIGITGFDELKESSETEVVDIKSQDINIDVC